MCSFIGQGKKTKVERDLRFGSLFGVVCVAQKPRQSQEGLGKLTQEGHTWEYDHTVSAVVNTSTGTTSGQQTLSEACTCVDENTLWQTRDLLRKGVTSY